VKLLLFFWRGDDITILVGKVKFPHVAERPPFCDERSPDFEV
jgi:hypothetical protein